MAHNRESLPYASYLWNFRLCGSTGMQVCLADQARYPIQDHSFVAHRRSKMPCAPGKKSEVLHLFTCYTHTHPPAGRWKLRSGPWNENEDEKGHVDEMKFLPHQNLIQYAEVTHARETYINKIHKVKQWLKAGRSFLRRSWVGDIQNFKSERA